MKKLFNLKMAENALVAQHLNEFNTITNQLSSVEIDFDDEIRALIVLASLPNSWEAMRMAVGNSTGKEKLKYNDIRDLILTKEIRRRDAGETSRSGHFRRQCKSPKKKNEDDSANVVTEEVQDALLFTLDSPLDDWVLNSRASFHTTPHREIIQNYVAGDFGKVYLADGSALNVVGLGDVWISLPNGSVWLLEKVQHIPDLRRNLISVGQLDDKGHAILFVGGTWKVIKEARVLARGKKIGTLYMTSCPRNTISIVDASTNTRLWHRRLGHMSEKGMKMLLSKGKLPELKSIDFDTCESCILGKQKKIGVAKRMNRTLNERDRNMRLHTGLPKTFWADVVSTVAYLINRGPSVPMEFRLPKEVWSGKEVMYKDRSTIVSDVTKIDQKKSEFVNLDELTKSTVQKGGEEDKENVNSQVDLSTPVAEVRRSSRNIRPLQRYSPALNYLMLIDGGELECYDEALQDENSSKRELAMKDEMDSLLGNQTWN
ncbi:Retrovirus-related Pol polyprotein from transposon TNT 1-94 [Vitis vinifera]|uniref:Retrovirus-related Pol polyprotein from transposon TNT 1-94 n=1 Tax=Vitis vinifera TaxID=29760 RepID=A0A438BTH9_VITVI|nr:Retrovirus-related Pol polyprotein from transposon TNT 1-94 [Vitis vinifera]